MARDKIPTSRVRRDREDRRPRRRPGRQAARHARRQRHARRARPREAALERRQLEAAEQIVTALGTMKGAAMKLGQVMSFLDVGLVPEEYREEFQAKLAALRDAAPKVTLQADAQGHRGGARGAARRVFAPFDEEPIAAASIGQVYRARCTTGARSRSRSSTRASPRAVRADMQNLGLIMRLMKRIAPGLDVKARRRGDPLRIGEELDYELEAQNQRSLARIFRGPPVHRRSRRRHPALARARDRQRVRRGPRLRGAQALAAGRPRPPRRDHLPLLLRLPVPPPPVLGRPHPGNFLLHGRRPRRLPGLRAVQAHARRRGRARARRPARAIEGDGEELHAPARRAGFLREPERVDPDRCRPLHGRDRLVHDRRGPLPLARRRDAGRDRHVGPALGVLRPDAPRDPAARPPLRAADGDADPRRARPAARVRQLAPVAREWIYGDDPVTELGEQEAEFYARAAA